jgi:hypothetical protein
MPTCSAQQSKPPRRPAAPVAVIRPDACGGATPWSYSRYSRTGRIRRRGGIARRVHPRLGGPALRFGRVRVRARLRALGVPARVRGRRLGSGAAGQRRRQPAAHRLKADLRTRGSRAAAPFSSLRARDAAQTRRLLRPRRDPPMAPKMAALERATRACGSIAHRGAIREVADVPAGGEFRGCRPPGPATRPPGRPWCPRAPGGRAVSRRPPPLVRPARTHARGEPSDHGRTTRRRGQPPHRALRAGWPPTRP